MKQQRAELSCCMHVHKVNFDAPNTYICIYATGCSIQFLIQFARVRTKRVRYNHGLLRAMLNRPLWSVKQMSVPKGLINSTESLATTTPIYLSLNHHSSSHWTKRAYSIRNLHIWQLVRRDIASHSFIIL